MPVEGSGKRARRQAADVAMRIGDVDARFPPVRAGTVHLRKRYSLTCFPYAAPTG